MERSKLKISPFFAVDVFSYDTVDSTNRLAKEYAAKHKSDAVFCAAGQSAGRGRLGRSFDSESGQGLYMSMLIHPKRRISDAISLTALSAVATCRAIEKLTSLEPRIKWVNDLQLGGKKIAGILVEGEVDSDGRVAYAVVGIGVNLLSRDFGELSEIAASLGDFTDTPPSADRLMAQTVRELYRIYKKPSYAAELEYYRNHSALIGEEITVYKGGESYPARAVGIDDAFGLIVNDGEKTYTLTSAEVSVRVRKG